MAAHVNRECENVVASVGITVEVDGNSLVAESHYTFNSSVVTDMNDVAGWVNNLAADFPVRVWRGEDGELLSDRLNVGEYLDSEGKGGRVVPVLMFEGGFQPRDKFVLGRILKGADLPALGRGWTAATEEIEGDEDHLVISACAFSRVLVLLRKSNEPEVFSQRWPSF